MESEEKLIDEVEILEILFGGFVFLKSLQIVTFPIEILVKNEKIAEISFLFF